MDQSIPPPAPMDRAMPPPPPPPTYLATTPQRKTALGEALTTAPLLGAEECNEQGTTENVIPEGMINMTDQTSPKETYRAIDEASWPIVSSSGEEKPTARAE